MLGGRGCRVLALPGLLGSRGMLPSCPPAAHLLPVRAQLRGISGLGAGAVLSGGAGAAEAGLLPGSRPRRRRHLCRGGISTRAHPPPSRAPQAGPQHRHPACPRHTPGPPLTQAGRPLAGPAAPAACGRNLPCSPNAPSFIRSLGPLGAALAGCGTGLDRPALWSTRLGQSAPRPPQLLPTTFLVPLGLASPPGSTPMTDDGSLWAAALVQGGAVRMPRGEGLASCSQPHGVTLPLACSRAQPCLPHGSCSPGGQRAAAGRVPGVFKAGL